MITHVFVEIDFGRMHCAALRGKLQQRAAGAIVGGHEHVPLADDGCGDVCSAVRDFGIAPQQLAVLHVQPDGGAVGERSHASCAPGIEADRRRIGCAVALRFPDDIASGLVERHDGSAAAAGIDNHPVRLYQRRFAISPLRSIAPEVLDEVDSPNALAGFCVETHERTVACDRIEAVAIDRRRAPRTVASIVAEGAAGGRFPERFAGVDIDGENEPLLALCKQAAAYHGKRGVAFAQTMRFPDQRRSGGRPLSQQPRFRGFSIAVRSAPLRPVGRKASGRERQRGQTKRSEHVYKVTPGRPRPRWLTVAKRVRCWRKPDRLCKACRIGCRTGCSGSLWRRSGCRRAVAAWAVQPREGMV